MASQIIFPMLNRPVMNKLINSNNTAIGATTINVKKSLLDAPKVLDPSLSGQKTVVQNVVQIANTGIKLIDSFTTKENVQFYKDVLNAIDNMILLDYMRDNVMPQQVEPVEYFVTKTLDLNLDLAIAYYVVKYPEDETVDQNKLEDLRNIIKSQLGI
jgi:uncharacterized protein YbcC (UPF0753/DUF2309 family)